MRGVALLAILLLFFLQLLAAFIETVYSFGLLQTSVPPGLAAATLVFLAPLLLLPFRGPAPRWLIHASAGMLLACRLAEPFIVRLPKAAVAGLGVACFFVLLPAAASRSWAQWRPFAVVGFALAGLAAMAVRTVGNGLDATRSGAGMLVAVALALLAAWLLATSPIPDPEPPAIPLRRGRKWALWLGISAGLALFALAFMAPNVIARWTGLPLTAILLVLTPAWTLLAALAAARPSLVEDLGRPLLLAGALLFTTFLALTLLLQQPAFPSDSAGYPLPNESPPTWPVWPMLILSPAVPLLLGSYVAELSRHPQSARGLAVPSTAAALLVLVLIVGQILTTVYDYMPVLGPPMRDRFWLVYAIAGLCVALPALAVSPPAPEVRCHCVPGSRILTIAALLLATLAIGAASLTTTAPNADERPFLRLVTYNIQQGFDPTGLKAHADQLAVLAGIAPDFVALQESDTNRIAGGNDDLVGWLAHELGMVEAYGPSPVAGTFGMALLSRFPIRASRTVYLESSGEQTAVLLAEIDVVGRNIVIGVTHLGNDGPVVQVEDLGAIQPRPDLLTGDFNFTHDSRQFAMMQAFGLTDSWDQAEATTETRLPEDLDHTFVGQEISVLWARYVRAPASDHPAYVVDFWAGAARSSPRERD